MKPQSYYLIFFILCCLFFSINTSAQSGPNVWTQKANVGGSTRYGGIGFSIDSLGYVGAGYSGSSYVNDFWSYNPRTNAWTQKNNVPAALDAASTFVINGKGYLTAGNISGAPFNTTLWMYDPVLNIWVTKSPYPGIGIYGGVGFAIGNKGYVGIGNTGGNTGPERGDFYQYNPSTDSWAKKDSFPGPVRFGTYGIGLNGNGYVGFGGDEIANLEYNDWWKYDTLTNTWAQKASLPSSGRSYPAGFTINNTIYVGIGHYDVPSLAKDTSDFYAYNPTSDSWSQIATFGGGKRWLAVGLSINNHGYVGTGYDFSKVYNDFWEYSPDTFKITTLQTNVTCFGNNNGSASVTITGGIKPFTYVWSQGGQTSSSISGLSAGTYTCTVTDSTGYSQVSANIIITQPAQIVISVLGKLSVCNGQSTPLTASGATTYTWAPLAGLNVTTGASVSASPTITTTYTITGTNSGGAGLAGCSGSTTVIVTVNPLPKVSVSGAIICNGQITPLTASGASTYSWTPSTGLNVTTGASVNANPTITTTYTITGINATQCSSSATATVTVNPLPTVVVAGAIICNGQTTPLTASGASTYTWTPSAGLNLTNGASVNANPTITTTYTIEGTSSAGCSGTTTAIVTVNPLPPVQVTPQATNICNGQTTPLTASGASTYTWTPSAGLNLTNGASVNANPTITTTYTITGKSSAGCTATTIATVTVNPLPVITVPPATICNGQSAMLTASGASTYTWSPSAGLSATTGSSVKANPSVPTTYTIVGTSQSGCTNTTTTVVNISPSLTITVAPAIICSGQSTPLTATGADTYTWAPGATLSATTGSSVNANPTSNTTYTIVGIANSGCSGTTTAVITVNQTPMVVVGGAIICNGQSTPLTASGASTYSWTPSTGLNITNGASVNANPTITTTYTITGSNATGCSNTTTAVVTVNPLPTVNVPAASVCSGFGTTLTASGASTYTWTPSTNLSATTGTSVNATPLSTTTYTVTGTSNNCANTTTVVVTVNPNPTASCSADSVAKTISVVASSGTGTLTYLWNTVPSQSTATANVTSTGTYSVVVTDANKCTAGCSSTITIPTTTTDCSGSWRTQTQSEWGTPPCNTCVNNGGCGNSCNSFSYFFGCGFNNGQGDGDNDNDDRDYNNTCKVGDYLFANFAAAFPAPGYLTVGCTTGNKLQLTSAKAVDNFLASQGNPRSLPTGTLVNPGSNYRNSLAGEVVALTLSITFDLIDPNFSSSSTPLQDLVVTTGTFSGWTVGQVLAEANTKLGGCYSKYGFDQLEDVVESINNDYSNSNNGCRKHFLKCVGSTTGNAREEMAQMPEIDGNGIQATAYPNPLNTTSTIEFIKTYATAKVSVEVYTITGSKVATLFNSQAEAGVTYKVTFDAAQLADGVYIYRITSGNDVINGKLILMKN